jgi:hypothetical protein
MGLKDENLTIPETDPFSTIPKKPFGIVQNAVIMPACRE